MSSIKIGRYQLGEAIGKGGFGVVFKALDTKTGEFVAVKQVPTHNLSKEKLDSLRMEISLLRRLNHRNIVKYHDSLTDGTFLYIVLEYVESGSLASIIKKYGSFMETLAAIYTSQVLRGMRYLHEQGVVHRDIKGANILTTKRGIVKLADFGVARSLSEAEKTSSVVGTPYWMAPEIIEMHVTSTACDIWSVGCTVIEMLTGKPPYFDLAPMPALFRIVQDPRPPLPHDISPELQSFLMACFEKNPEKRITAAELMEHEWIRHFSKQGLQVTQTLTTDGPSLLPQPPSHPLPMHKGHHVPHIHEEDEHDHDQDFSDLTVEGPPGILPGKPSESPEEESLEQVEKEEGSVARHLQSIDDPSQLLASLPLPAAAIPRPPTHLSSPQMSSATPTGLPLPPFHHGPPGPLMAASAAAAAAAAEAPPFPWVEGASGESMLEPAQADDRLYGREGVGVGSGPPAAMAASVPPPLHPGDGAPLASRPSYPSEGVMLAAAGPPADGVIITSPPHSTMPPGFWPAHVPAPLPPPQPSPSAPIIDFTADLTPMQPPPDMMMHAHAPERVVSISGLQTSFSMERLDATNTAGSQYLEEIASALAQLRSIHPLPFAHPSGHEAKTKLVSVFAETMRDDTLAQKVASQGTVHCIESLHLNDPEVTAAVLQLINHLFCKSSLREHAESLLSPGLVAQALRFTHAAYDARIRLEAGRFMEHLSRTRIPTQCLDQFSDAVVNLIRSNYYEDEDLVHVGIDVVDAMVHNNVLRNDFCRLFACKYGVRALVESIDFLAADLADLAASGRKQARSRLDKVLDALECLFSSSSFVKVWIPKDDYEQLRFVIDALSSCLDILGTEAKLKVLKCFHGLASEGSFGNIFENEGMVERLVHLLLREETEGNQTTESILVRQEIVWNIHILSKVSKPRQEQAALAGIVPLMIRIVQDPRPSSPWSDDFRAKALEGLGILSQASSITRHKVKEDGGVPFFIDRLGDLEGEPLLDLRHVALEALVPMHQPLSAAASFDHSEGGEGESSADVASLWSTDPFEELLVAHKEQLVANLCVAWQKLACRSSFVKLVDSTGRLITHSSAMRDAILKSHDFLHQFCKTLDEGNAEAQGRLLRLLRALLEHAGELSPEDRHALLSKENLMSLLHGLSRGEMASVVNAELARGILRRLQYSSVPASVYSSTED